MAYEKTNWVDNQTPLSAENLNKMEDGIVEASKTGGMLTGSVIGYNGDEIPEGYEEVKKGYSIEEILTGETWIDGKPIYRKVVNTNSPSQTLTQQIVGTLGNGLNELISLKGMIDIGEYGVVPIPQAFDSENINNLWLESYSSGNIICIVSVTNYTNSNLKIIAEYTKTTD